jgi:hypothetical protein
MAETVEDELTLHYRYRVCAPDEPPKRRNIEYRTNLNVP